jgi:exocyst complex component 2
LYAPYHALADRHRSILLELDPQSDPAWIYLEHQHKRLLDRLKAVRLQAAEGFEKAAAEERQSSATDAAYTLDLRDCVATVDSVAADAVFETLPSSATWQSALGVGRTLAEALMAELPGFWKVALAYTQGKYTKARFKPTLAVLFIDWDPQGMNQNSGRNAVACKAMTNEIINSYIALLSAFFQFATNRPAPNADELPPLPTYVPPNSNALCTAFHLEKLVAEINDNAAELGALNLPDEAAQNLKDFVATARWQFEDVLCIAWVKGACRSQASAVLTLRVDAKALYRLESWVANPDEPSTTMYLKSADAFQRSMARRAYRVAGGAQDHAQNIFLPALGPAICATHPAGLRRRAIRLFGRTGPCRLLRAHAA